MTQTWHDLLFAHWPIPADQLRPLVPSELALDTYEGKCWVGVVPFHMSDIRRRGLPALPGISSFPELNVRTYVTLGGKPGVYFFSLDAANAAAVWAARRFYHLPYFHAQMSSTERNGWIHYESVRNRADARFRGRFRGSSAPTRREKGTIDHWFTERYCLYTVKNDQVYCGEIHHQPWPLQDAEAEIELNSMAAAAGISLSQTPPVLHFAKRLEVLIWPLQRVSSA